jgi:glutathione S-transferase
VGAVGYNYLSGSLVLPMEPKLYVILGSHSCRTGMLMLEHKGVSYRRVEVPTGLHPLAMRLLGFEGNAAPLRSTGERPNRALGVLDRMGTVPALRIGDERVKTNHAIARFLERHYPDPPLFPVDPEHRAAVEEAERWGDQILQMAARRLVMAATVRGRDGLLDRGDRGRLGPLLYRRAATRRLASYAFGRVIFAAGPDREREVLLELDPMLDRVDTWIEAGVLGGEQLYAADFVIAPSLALLCYRPDVRADIERRPALALVDRILPEP